MITCQDCGRRLTLRTIQVHACIPDLHDDVAPDIPDVSDDYTDAELDEAADREVARYEAGIYGEDGVA